eukprot:CAMPEP_0172083402 /NCGR_PEP_ID=MMETSP1043-20130122/20415_1 /TAXON_ID=464988 /ORGANISM="Hemiselmis andersenii, Strain CCMP441" /LENGTH=183 /DNA_ID=CAMNT_0012745105 /DNA_START=566 /DNA_END=1114 /DNA_ORIENTATION=+
MSLSLCASGGSLIPLSPCGLKPGGGLPILVSTHDPGEAPDASPCTSIRTWGLVLSSKDLTSTVGRLQFTPSTESILSPNRIPARSAAPPGSITVTTGYGGKPRNSKPNPRDMALALGSSLLEKNDETGKHSRKSKSGILSNDLKTRLRANLPASRIAGPALSGSQPLLAYLNKVRITPNVWFR